MNSFLEEDDRPTDVERRFATLLHDYLEDKLDEAGSCELTNLVVSREDFRVLFVDTAVQHTILSQIFQEDQILQKIIEDGAHLTPTTARRGNRRWLTAAAILAACFLFYGSFALLSVGIWRSDSADRDAAEAPAIAVLDTVEDCVWDETSSAFPIGPRSGEPLKAGSRLKMKQGCAVIKFSTGARITMQAPCELRLESADRVALSNGRIYAVVTAPAAGFTVKTPQVVFVDRGTRFGVVVTANQQAALHVFEGIVESRLIKSAEKQPQRVVAGEAIQYVRDGSNRLPANPTLFAPSLKLAERQRSTERARSVTPIAKSTPQSESLITPKLTQDIPRTTRLVDLEPTATGYGMMPDPNQIFTEAGPGKMDPRCQGVFWKDSRKVVKSIAPEQALPAGTFYRTLINNDCFAVGGEFVTGVGLWARSRLMYHWLEYDIPQGARRFTGKLLVSDDPTNAEYPSANQNFIFTVTIDGKEAAMVNKLLPKQVFGSGQKLEDLDFAIPADAKTIRFRLESTPWGDGNLNNEVIVNEGVFASATTDKASADADASPH